MHTFSRSQPQPDQVVVGTAYYFASGAVNSLTQLKRLAKARRIRPLFKMGSRLRQFKNIADEDIARLIGQRADPAA
jgi:hypothetical protein